MSRPEPSTNLPAPYRSPWRSLAEDLRAVAASLRLGLQELVRRNGQGDLPRPARWPRDLAPLFWPLLLALALALLLWVGVVLGRWLGPAANGPNNPGSPATPTEIPAELPLEIPATSPPARPADAPPPDRSAPLGNHSGGPPTDAPAPAETTQPAASPAVAPDSGADAPAGSSAPARTATAADPADADPTDATPAASAEPDPLAELVASPASAGLLRSASAEPASASLQLVLADGFLGLPSAEQQRRAEGWQQLALGLGYEHLQLRDGHGALLGREAVVGGGMILLSPPERD